MSDVTDHGWVRACAAHDIDIEDVARFDHDGRTFALYRSPEDTFHATDGLCTHERAHLADGFVMGDIVECPKHNGRFDYKTGEVRRRPACIDLATYPVKVVDGDVFVALERTFSSCSPGPSDVVA
jgi:3-phenylpropionate/trans-cinnamate dioxygenase ferredoxin component